MKDNEKEALKAFGLDDKKIQDIEQVHKDLAEHYSITMDEAEDYLMGKGLPAHAAKQIAEERAMEAKD